MLKLDPAFLFAHEKEFADHIGLPIGQGGYKLKKEKGAFLRVEIRDKEVLVTYNKLCELFRGIALLKEDLADGTVIEQHRKWDSMGAFCDCSRNAVMRVQTIKCFVMDIVALGFDQLQLYTEDTFEIPEQPYFGHLRGRYSKEEIREVVAFAEQFGVEVVPAVQTLAHLNAIFQWKAFDQIHDIGDILLCEEEKTYEFLDQMVASLRDMYTTEKINVGMDEAHMLGLGKYLAQKGYHSRMEMFLKHISRVMKILLKYGFKPMMWSDMFFKIACGRCTYEELEVVEFDEALLDLIPKEMALAYWNYSSTDKKYMDMMFKAHLSMGREIVFAGGFRKWAGFCPTLQASFDATRVALKSAYENGIKKVMVTGWGDDGAEGSAYLLLPGLVMYAEDCYADDMSDEAIDLRLRALFGYGLDEFRLLEEPNRLPGNEWDSPIASSALAKIALWNDPLLGKYDRHIVSGCNSHYAQIAERLSGSARKNNRLSYVFETICTLCEFLAVKTELGNQLRDAYQKKDTAALKEACKVTGIAIERLDAFHQTFRRNWLRENKIFGFDVQDIRFGALRARLAYTQQAVQAYLDGETDGIAELEEPSMYCDCREEEMGIPLHFGRLDWTQLVTASVL